MLGGRRGSVIAHMSSAVHELRRARRKARLADLEWFDIAYRFYLWAFAGAVVILWASGQVSDDVASRSQVDGMLAHGPPVIGVVAAFAFALGCRSGSDGGPIALEPADVRHLMMAPVSRREVLRLPIAQRLRTATGFGALAGAVAGHLAAARLPGSGASWTMSGALAGALLGTMFVVTAVVVHAVAVPRWMATTIGLVAVAWQGAAVVTPVPGPFDTLGSLALWGMRQHVVDVVAIVVVVALTVTAFVMCDRLRAEELARRADLVSQLRFAATMQDLRTVVLLRRQLRDEHPRAERWWPRRTNRTRRTTTAAIVAPTAAQHTRFGGPTSQPAGGDGDQPWPSPRWPAATVWRRGLDGLSHTPVPRLVRMLLLTATAAGGVVATLRGTTPATLVTGFALFILGLEAAEAMSQEVDHPDRTDGLPRERGWMLLHHLPAAAIMLVPFALIGAATVAVFEPSAARAALALCIPVTFVGGCGSVASIVRDSPDPVSAPAATTAVPAEFAGFTTMMHALIPLVISALADLPALAAREFPEPFVVARLVIGCLLVIATTVAWVRHRDAIRRRISGFVEAGKAAR